MWGKIKHQFPLFAAAALSLQYVKESEPAKECPAGVVEPQCNDEKQDTCNKPVSNKLIGRLELFRHKWGIPGLCFMASIDGVTRYNLCIGHSDVENSITCDNHAVMRIASISKSFTAVGLLKLWEKGKLDLHKPIQEYVENFPLKSYKGNRVDITAHQILSHTAGIRGYTKPLPGTAEKMLDYKEMLIKDSYNINESLKLFQDDDLVAEPGSGVYVYSTHAWTLLSAVIEGITNTDFLKYMNQELLQPLNMTSTIAEYNDTLIMNRSRHYRRDNDGLLLNTPYVDLSYKWAGGGYLATVEDLTKFGNALLLSYNQHQRKKKGMTTSEDESKYILKPSTVDMMWTPVATNTGGNYTYGLGWQIAKPAVEQRSESNEPSSPLIVYHSGGTIGASSILVIIPGPVTENDDPHKPKGIIVSLLVNLQEVKEIEELGISLALKLYENEVISALS